MFPVSDTKTSGHFPFVTVGLIALNVYVFFLQLTSPNIEGFIREYALVPSLVNFSDLPTLLPFITSQFLHGGFLHIIGNMLFLWIFGDNVEHRLGIWYLPFYLIGGVIAGLSQYVLNAGSDIPMLGASGAVAAVLGAYLVWYPHHQVKTLVFLGPVITFMTFGAPIMLGYWFLTQVLSGTTAIVATSQDQGGVAYFAHIGGFVYGYLLARLVGKSPSTEDRHLEHA